jgi:membrane AbrB-like protein
MKLASHHVVENLRPKLMRFALALMVGAIGGAIFYALALPLPWTLGAMTASGISAVIGRRWFMPMAVREFARPVIGVMAGGAFTPAVLASLGTWWPAIVMMLLYTLVMILLGWLLFTKLLGLDRTTAFFASAPGGLGELTLLGSSLGGDLRSLVLIHSVRVVMVVFSTPFILKLFSVEVGARLVPSIAAAPHWLDWAIMAACAMAGYLIGKQFRIPGGVMIPALLLSAGAHGAGLTAAAPPNWLVGSVQVIIGAIAGSRFVDVRWRQMLRVLVGAAIWAAALIGGAIVSAIAGSFFLDRPMAALVLAFMPGGMAEMTIISFAVGIEVAFVVTCQVCRILAVYVSAPLLFRMFGETNPPDDDQRPADGKT